MQIPRWFAALVLVLVTSATGSFAASSTLDLPATKVDGTTAQQFLQMRYTGGTWAGTLTADNSKITITGTDEGYTSDTLGTHTRTLRVLSVTNSGSGTLIFWLSEPIYNDSTSWTVTMDAGAITDGTDTSNAVSGLSIDNSTNTYDYPTVTNHIFWPPPWSRQTDTFDIWVEAAGGRFDDRPGILGIEAVKISLTDGTTTVTEMATFSLRTSTSTYRAYDSHPGWKATFDAADFAGQVLATGTITVYPTIGDASSIRARTWKIWLDKANADDVETAYVDESYTITGTGVGTFTDLEYITQATTGAVGIVWGSGQGGGASIQVAGIREQPTNANSSDVWTGASSGATWTPSAAPTANVSGGALNDVNSPYPDVRSAMMACEGARSSPGSYASHSTIYVKTPYTIGPDGGGGTTRPDTRIGPCYIRPWSGVSGGTDRIICNGSRKSAGLRTACIELYDHVITRDIVTSGAQSGEELSGGATPDQAIGFRGMKFIGTRNGGSSTTFAMFPQPSQWLEGIWFYDCYFYDLRSDVEFDKAFAVDCEWSQIGEDLVGGSSNGCMVNSVCGALVAGGAHASVWQTLSTGNVNRGAYFSDFTNLDVTTTGTSAGVFTLQGSGNALTSAAVVGCTFPDLISNTSMEGDVESRFHWFSTLGRERFDQTGGLALKNVFYYGCAIHNIQIGAGDTGYLSPYMFRNCHEFGTAYSIVLSTFNGEENTTGSTPADAFVSPGAGGDYSPKASSVLLDRVLAAYSDVLTWDAKGRTLSQDAAALASIGPLQPTATLAVTYSGDAMSDGGSTSEAEGSHDLVFTVGGPTGAVAVVSDVAFSGTVSGTDASPYTLTKDGTTTAGTITTTLTEGSAGVDITWTAGVFDFDITGTGDGGGGGSSGGFVRQRGFRRQRWPRRRVGVARARRLAHA